MSGQGWVSSQRGWVSGHQIGEADTPLRMDTAAVGTHPTGIHSCWKFILIDA